MLAIYKKELRYYFATPTGYIVIGLYLLAVSLFLWVIPGEYNIPDSGYAQADGLFRLSPWLFMLLCPAITMRLFAEEKQNGTWNLLRTKPISVGRIVTEKYLAAWTVVFLAQLPCLIHYLLVYRLADPIGNIDAGAFFGSFIGLLFLSAAFCAIGCWASAITRSQIIAFIVGLTCCFLIFYGFDLLSTLFNNGHIANCLQWCGLNEHYRSISRGVIDLRDVVWFLSVSVLFCLFAIRRMK
ncbi:MAG: ABC transporter permease [Paludibacter sp.]|nr:ABC transporter permease [Bacteroidales bacterium]MCM1068906.1 ABC transporter permease [Prevotella sp.]MCM1353167.1 ABC transporter permease [Bacteroides sp.]MCM1442489.1 ABC transporter permease [Muribaculum sp.]MCM1481332.1 ABC transporter permease [Paludibacter sp.]